MSPTTETAPPDLACFLADRLGMFIHFGLYALAGRHEWVQNRERITPEDYRRSTSITSTRICSTPPTGRGSAGGPGCATRC